VVQGGRRRTGAEGICRLIGLGLIDEAKELMRMIAKTLSAERTSRQRQEKKLVSASANGNGRIVKTRIWPTNLQNPRAE